MKKIIVESKKHGTKEILVDDEDFEPLSKIRWNVVDHSHTFYARAHKTINGKHSKIYMHRHLLNAHGRTNVVDHKDHNGLNNQKDNIRICTQSENLKNRTPRKNGSSKYLGVGRHYKTWRAFIMVDGKYKSLGVFDTEECAAAAYDEAALLYHKDFANINGIDCAE